MPSDPVAGWPAWTMPAEIATDPPWQMIPIGLPASWIVPNQLRDRLVAAELVGQPAAGDDEPVEPGSVRLGGEDVGARRQPVLAVDRVERHADGGHGGARLAEAHHGHPVLEVLDALGDEDGDAHAGKRSRAAGIERHRAVLLRGSVVVSRPLSTRSRMECVSPSRC